MRLRRFEKADIHDVLSLFHETVHTVNAADYSREQLDAWAPVSPNEKEWVERLTTTSSLVVERDGKIVGFGNITADGEVDTLYVHKDAQHKGIGAAILMRLVAEAKSRGIREIRTFASITSRPFFEKQGFFVQRHHTVTRDGISLENVLMTMPVLPSDGVEEEQDET